MTTAAQDILDAFDKLPSPDKQAVAAEILRRSAEAGELTDAAFDDLASETFGAYDAEEQTNAER